MNSLPTHPPVSRFPFLYISRYVIALAGAVLEVAAAEINLTNLPPPAKITVDFDRDIKPIFEAACFRCHGPEKPKSKFRLDNRESALQGGEVNDRDIIPGESARSPLIHYVVRVVEDMEMPPPGKGDPLTPGQIGLLRAWIDQGAQWPAESATAARSTLLTITPAVQWISVTGDQRKFREDWGKKEGFAAGYEHFELRQPIGKDAEWAVEGRAMFDQKDYRVGVTLQKQDVGFIRGGYETYRKYFDDSGGYYRPFNLPPFSLDRNLHLDIGKAWFDVGLTLPNWPRIVAGYEYQFKEGAKSTLQWGQASGDPTAFFGKAIYPSFKAIDESAHVIKLDVTHEIANVFVEDNFRVEFYEADTRRVHHGEFAFSSPALDTLAEHREIHEHFQAVNALRAEKQMRDWLLLSGGYLYSRLDGNGAFRQNFSSVSATFPAYSGDSSDRIELKQESHVFNANVRLGPWEGLTGSAGVQSEWTRREGFSDSVQNVPSPVTAPQTSHVDKSSLDETFGLRYDRIPFTVVYAEARLQQEWIDHFERQSLNDGFADNRDFNRDTDATGDLKEYRGGFTVSPWRQVSINASYKRREKQTDYDHRIDADGSQPPFVVSGNGYPAFILARDITSDEVETKLVLRLASWLKTTWKYQLVATDYETRTDSATNTFASLFYPGGEILAGDQDAHVYSVNATLTSWRRLYLSSTFSYSDSRIVTGINGVASIAPYRGDVYSVLASGNFALDASTDLHASYSFSRADYEQKNQAGLPLGIEYDRHGLTAGIRRRLSKNLTGNIQYGFFRYREPTAAGANDYEAHAMFASLSLRIP